MEERNICFIEDVVDSKLYLPISYKMGKNGYCGVSATNRGKGRLTSLPNYAMQTYCIEKGEAYIQISKDTLYEDGTKLPLQAKYILTLKCIYDEFVQNHNGHGYSQVNEVFLEAISKVYKEELPKHINTAVFDWMFDANYTKWESPMVEEPFVIEIYGSKQTAVYLNQTMKVVKESNSFDDILNYLDLLYKRSKRAKNYSKRIASNGEMDRFRLEHKDDLCPFLNIPANTIDHKIPLEVGGSNTVENMIMMSKIENNLKGSYTYEEYAKITEQYFTKVNEDYHDLYYKKVALGKLIEEISCLNKPDGDRIDRLNALKGNCDRSMQEIVNFKVKTLALLRGSTTRETKVK